MTDDTDTDSPADDPRIEALTRASRSIHVAPLDTARFVRAARARRRRRRTIGSSVLASAVIVAGVSVATAGSSSPGQNTNVDATALSDALERQALTVRFDENTRPGRGEEVADAARWRASSQTLTYRLGNKYGWCLNGGSSARHDGGSVTLILGAAGPGVDCDPTASNSTFTISGLAEAPAELVVEVGGLSESLPVEQEPETTGNRVPTAGSLCPDGVAFGESRSLDRASPPPGVSLEDALVHYPGATIAPRESDDVALATVSANGQPVRVIALSRWPNDSWVVSSVVTC